MHNLLKNQKQKKQKLSQLKMHNLLKNQKQKKQKLKKNKINFCFE
jgi:hypothetical protein